MKRKDEIKIEYFLKYNYEAKHIAGKLNQYQRGLFNICFIHIERLYKLGHYNNVLYLIYKNDYITIYIRQESKNQFWQKISNTPIDISIIIVPTRSISCQMRMTVTNPNFWLL